MTQTEAILAILEEQDLSPGLRVSNHGQTAFEYLETRIEGALDAIVNNECDD